MCRIVDGIQSNNYYEPLNIYTFDLAEDGIQPEQKKKEDKKGDKEKEQ
eukprot:CAMPEP_0168313516 /NCGR_PEP_ID=MMETSP0210-20121227/2460_1 /TAXON_ID=40633 /ORGANISM="Condylostoma magnum, Strain COL2" /LENGTH=47 /DNA_ID= /DNA_START= /DNA_END= /DNA_ORIENTATION=